MQSEELLTGLAVAQTGKTATPSSDLLSSSPLSLSSPSSSSSSCLSSLSLPSSTASTSGAGESNFLCPSATHASPSCLSSGKFWWDTSGQDLARALDEADYSRPARDAFLSFWKDTVCPQLGPGPDSSSGKSAISWDGNPFEYSFDLKGSTKKPKVRVCVDATQLRPMNPSKPLCTETTQQIVAWMRDNLPSFDETWFRSLSQSLVFDHLPAERQHALVSKAGHRSTLILGLDINDQAPTHPGGLSGMGKIYFMPCIAAEAQGISRFEVVRRAILRTPGIESLPNMIASLGVLESFMAGKPAEWQDGVRFLATDFVAPGKARIKIYLRCLAQEFDGIWDCYTLGGRIAGMDEDKPKIRDFVNFVCGRSDTSEEASYLGSEGVPPAGSTTGSDSSRSCSSKLGFTTIRKKASYVYYSLSPDSPMPAPKIGVYPSLTAANDGVVVRGLDRWLAKYGWADDRSKSMEARISNTLTHRKLEDRNGIVTFFGIGRKEDATKKGLSIQTYLTSELYHDPRTGLATEQPLDL